jgi:diphthine synthase
MLYFIGLGLDGFDSLSSKAIQILQEKADYIYLESFTSPINEGQLLEKCRDVISCYDNTRKCHITIAKRWMVEDGSEILQNAQDSIVVMLCYGDPYIATTHIELRTRAISQDIPTQTIHNASAITSMIGQCGLHYYKIGRITTIMNDIKVMTTPYYIIYKNLIEGNHTILLLEYDRDGDKFFLEPGTALSYLIETEKEQQRNVITLSSFVIIASRIGLYNQKITAGKISSFIGDDGIDFGEPPHSIIIPGMMHFTESDALKVLAHCVDEPFNNSDNTKKISQQMMSKYVPMINDAIKEISPYYSESKEFKEVLENAKLYVKDAQKFLKDGKDEVAILSIGYADGLVDSLRIAKGLEPK